MAHFWTSSNIRSASLRALELDVAVLRLPDTADVSHLRCQLRRDFTGLHYRTSVLATGRSSSPRCLNQSYHDQWGWRESIVPSFLIGLVLVIREQRDGVSGVTGKTDTRAFMAVGSLLGEKHSFHSSGCSPQCDSAVVGISEIGPLRLWHVIDRDRISQLPVDQDIYVESDPLWYHACEFRKLKSKSTVIQRDTSICEGIKWLSTYETD